MVLLASCSASDQRARSSTVACTVSRVLVRVAEFRARTFFELERHARKVDWAAFASPGRPVRLRVTSRKSKLYHQRAIEQRLLEAIGAPAARPAEGEDEEEGAAEQLFVVRFLHDRCTISADSSGALLHLRGYRQAVARAPLRETLAAAMLLGIGWQGQAPLVDQLLREIGIDGGDVGKLARGMLDRPSGAPQLQAEPTNPAGD